jgi:hypothetical protein
MDRKYLPLSPLEGERSVGWQSDPLDLRVASVVA